MTEEELAKVMARLGRDIEKALPADYVFALVVTPNDGGDMRVFVRTDVDPNMAREFLLEAAKTIEAPDKIRGGN
jgi:hypothetical protein